MVNIAAMCLTRKFLMQPEPEFRPPMSEIVQDLANILSATGEESE